VLFKTQVIYLFIAKNGFFCPSLVCILGLFPEKLNYLDQPMVCLGLARGKIL